MQFDLLTRRMAAGLEPASVRWSPSRAKPRAPAAGPWLHANVPLHLLTLHDARLADAIWAQVRGLLKRPTQSIVMPGGATAVQVLGTAVFVRSASGQLHPFLWGQPGCLERVATDRVMVTEIPYGSLWLERVVRQALEMRNRALEDALPQEVNEYVTWLTAKMARRIRACCNMRIVRLQVTAALGIDPVAWRLGHRLQLGSPLDSKSTVRQYNVCVRHREALLEVERVAPQALGIFGALCSRRDFPVQGEPLQRLKGFLRSNGLGSRAWLLVLHGGGRLLRMARHFYRGAVGCAVLDVLQVMQKLGQSRMLPSWLFQALFAEWGHAGGRRTSYAKPMQASMDNLGHVVRCLLPRNTAPTNLEEEQIAEVVHWISEPETRTLTRKQRQGGWDYLVKHAREHHRRLEVRAAAYGITWPVPFENVQAGKLRLVAISSALQLVEEGTRMRNCAGNFQNKCASGSELLVSVFSNTGKRVATASYVRRADGWSFSEAKGPMNRPLPVPVMGRLRKLAALIPAGFEELPEAGPKKCGSPAPVEKTRKDDNESTSASKSAD